MSEIIRKLHDRITVVSAPTVPGGYGGQTVRDWSAATRTMEPALVQPETAQEDTAARQTTITTWRLFLLPSSTVTAVSRVEWRGMTLEVAGEVAEWVSRGRVHHKEVVAMRAVDA